MTIEVPANHRLLVLKRELGWAALEAVLALHWRAAGKNLDGGRGRPFDLAFYTRAVVLMLLLRLTQSRQLERELKENAVARLFVEVEQPRQNLWRDHSNLDRTWRALGVAGVEAICKLILDKAVELGFADLEELSSDTTAQQAHIGYPNDPTILGRVAKATGRLLRRLGGAAAEAAQRASESIKQILGLVKHYHLFAKSTEEKAQTLQQLCNEIEPLLQLSEQQAKRLAWRPESILRNAVHKLLGLTEFARTLLPQIRHWLKTGEVAPGKLLHPTVPEARAIPVNKPPHKWLFGFKWLINRLGAGYLFGRMFLHTTDESSMPVVALEHYQQLFGPERTPKLQVYDRGGHSAKTIEKLRAAGIQKIGIVPKGQACWLVEEAEQDTVMKLRSRTEGVIGTLKTAFYGFDKPKQRSRTTIEMAGHGSIVSFNLNKLLRDLQKKDKEAA